ncbi:MAG TPA: hypothetical protein VHB68_13810 [Steroidobacteraceae bacterium]|nr:hypothetical protein [Steroidobacteraceae bacterium]
MRFTLLTLLTLCACAEATAAPKHLEAAGVAIRADVDDGTYRVGSGAITAWIIRSAEIVAQYYDRFPTTSLHIRVVPEEGDGVRGGKTFGREGGFIRVEVGRDVTADQLRNDWVLVHEMTHLALPDTGEEHAWLSEGLAVYVEGVARVQAGNRTQADVWAEEIRSMPRGLPQPGDAGLDHTHTWGRTYWGGAMFCLLADVEIHRRTANRYGLQDALRAIVRESGGLVTDWPVERVFKTGDAAVGTPVLEDLYAKMKDTPIKPDLMSLWRQLGVEPDGSSVRLSDEAPLAAIRQSIMQPRGSLIPARKTPSSPR